MSCWVSLAGQCGVLELGLEVLPASRVLLQSVGTEKHLHAVKSHVARDDIHHM